MIALHTSPRSGFSKTLLRSFAKAPLAQQIQCCVSLSMSDFEERWLPRYGKWSTFTRHSFAIVIVGGGAKVSDGGWWRTWVFLMLRISPRSL